MRRVLICLMVIFGSAVAAAAETPAQPDPKFKPQQVIELQLDALRQGDDAGIARVWAFAHPANKRLTGPLARFTRMIKSAPYAILLGHLSHEIEALRRSPERVLFGVTVTGAEGKVVLYRWTVSKIKSGPLEGAWLTSVVSPPIEIGDAI